MKEEVKKAILFVGYSSCLVVMLRSFVCLYAMAVKVFVGGRMVNFLTLTLRKLRLLKLFVFFGAVMFAYCANGIVNPILAIKIKALGLHLARKACVSALRKCRPVSSFLSQKVVEAKQCEGDLSTVETGEEELKAKDCSSEDEVDTSDESVIFDKEKDGETEEITERGKVG